MRFFRSQLVVPALTFLCFSLGSAFLVSGVVPKVFGETKSVEAAAKQYTSEWKATRVVKVQWGGKACNTIPCTPTYVYSGIANAYWPKQFPGGSSFSSLVGRMATIGVAEWEVKGQVPTSGTYFKEAWAIPGSRNLDVRIENNDQGIKQVGSVSPSTVNLGDFSIGIADEAAALRFFTTAVPANNNPKANGGQFLAPGFSNGSTYCFPGNQQGNESDQCIASTGSYGWGRTTITSSAPFSNEFRDGHVFGLGNFMPLKWTVTGNVCDKATDPECR